VGWGEGSIWGKGDVKKTYVRGKITKEGQKIKRRARRPCQREGKSQKNGTNEKKGGGGSKVQVREKCGGAGGLKFLAQVFVTSEGK